MILTIFFNEETDKINKIFYTKSYRNGSRIGGMYNAQALRANWNDSRVDFTIYELVDMMPWQPPRLARVSIQCYAYEEKRQQYTRLTFCYNFSIKMIHAHKCGFHTHCYGDTRTKFYWKAKQEQKNGELMKQQKIFLNNDMDFHLALRPKTQAAVCAYFAKFFLGFPHHVHAITNSYQ